MNMHQGDRQTRPVETGPLHFPECGLADIYLDNGFEREEIDGESCVSIHDLDGLLAAIALHLALGAWPLSAREMRFLRHELDLSQSALADLLGVSSQSVARWEKDKSQASGPDMQCLRALYIARKAPEADRGRYLELLFGREPALTARPSAEAPLVLHSGPSGWQVREAGET